ncbi:MAG TPA: HAD-IA family hydrolase [Tetragenococcus sp.]|nr:HAD-IA family hydrolase [Tetragenococcus sp.]
MILNKKYLMFDLDGTIVDSSEGIFASINYAMKQLQKTPLDTATLKMFVGPPLQTSFKKIGLSDTEARLAVAQYRVLYKKQGMFQVQPYQGIKEALAELSQEYDLFLATAKPEIFAKEILNRLQFSKYFTAIYGSDLAGKRPDKSSVIAILLKNEGIKEIDRTLMIGDRNDDVLGAKAHLIDTLGVLYGFGDKTELVSAGAKWLIQKPEELLEVLSVD